MLSFIGSINETRGQKQPPKSNKSSVQAKNFVSQEGGFSVRFPKYPTKKTNSINSAFGQTTLTTFQAATTTALFSVMYVDFPTAIKDEDELNIRFDAMKNSIISNGSYNLVSEKIIYYEESPGREFLMENAKLSVTMRGFIVEQRFFQLMVITPGKMSKSTAKVKAANQKKIDDFINSFAITKLPTPKTLAVELPEDFGVSIEDSVFSSQFLGVSFEIPPDWSLLNEEQVDLVKLLGLSAAQENKDYQDNALERSIKNSKFLLIATDRPIGSGESQAFLMIIAERVSFPNFLPAAISNTYIKIYLDPTEKVVKPTTLTKINGVEFAWVETFDSSDNSRKRMYVANRKGIAFEIFFTFKTDAQLQVLLKSINSMKFEENQ